MRVMIVSWTFSSAQRQFIPTYLNPGHSVREYFNPEKSRNKPLEIQRHHHHECTVNSRNVVALEG